MNLFRETAQLLAWLARIGTVFLRLRPLTTVTVIAASTLSRTMSILAFVLPLKIILLVGSDGVSQWFAPIVGPEGKDALVVALTAAAIISFFASIALDALTDHLAESTSHSVLQGSNELAVVGDQFGHARAIYAQYTDLVAGALFAGTGLAVAAVINPVLGGILVGVIFAQFALTAALLAKTEPARPGLVARFVLHDLGDYLKILSSLDFLLSFAVLLYPFIWGSGGNVLGSLVCIIVLRRTFTAMVEVNRTAVAMAGRKAMIDALVFRDRQYQQTERCETRSLREVFHKQARQARTAEALKSAGVELDGLEVRWQDSRLAGVSLLAVHGTAADGATVRYQQQIFPSKQDYRIRNEDVLFTHIPRARLHAPPLLLRFSEGPFECQLLSMGTGQLIDEQLWAETQWTLYKALMAIEPPRPLIDTFALSRPLLVDQLTDHLLQRLAIGIDTDEEQATFEALRASMPALRATLADLPLYIDNPELRRPNVMLNNDNLPLIMSWGKWTLEPIGATIPAGMSRQALHSIVGELRSERSDITDRLSVEHIQLAGMVYHMEKKVRHNLAKEALGVAQRIVTNTALRG